VRSPYIRSLLLLDQLLDAAVRRRGSFHGRVRFVSLMVPRIINIKNPILREALTLTVAEKAKCSPRAIHACCDRMAAR
jgi:hypothetical protein